MTPSRLADVWATQFRDRPAKMSQLAGMSIEVAKDELCVQTVILESLLHESLEGVDEDIAEAEGKIAELKAFIGEAEERDEEGPEDAQGEIVS